MVPGPNPASALPGAATPLLSRCLCANEPAVLTVPAAFQALVVLAEIAKGDDVLVHAGASGVGIAAIQLARFYGA